MSGGFFARLEAELGDLTRSGAHLDEPSAIRRRRMQMRVRHGLLILAAAATLAISLDSEFAAQADGYGAVPAASVQAVQTR